LPHRKGKQEKIVKHRPAPRPVNYKSGFSAKLKTDRQIQRWIQRLTGDPEARPTDLGEEQLAFVHAEVMKRRADLSAAANDHYVKAMHDTCPILAAPDLDREELADDLRLIWAQPEMRNFWRRWEGPRAGMGPTPDYLTAKALMAGMGMTGISAHADDIYAEVTGRPEIWSIFESLDGEQAEAFSYQNALRQLPKLGAQTMAVGANVDMVREIARLNPGKGVGERLMIDGMALPAWCKQTPKGTPEQEAYRRRFTPEAGFRAYIHSHRNKESVGAKSKQPVEKFLSSGKAWRGYYLVVIADQATGLPLVWLIVDASINEEASIVPLLSDLYRAWPECPAKLIAGDSAWDKDVWCRLCEVDYGIHPVFRLHNQEHFASVAEHSRDGSINAIDEGGRLICTTHGSPLTFVGTEHGDRAGLFPGQSAKEGQFRVRGKCRSGCGTLGLKMAADWSRLTHYPHHKEGHLAEKRYAERQALLSRLNGMEGIFQRLQNGKNLGTKGAARTRIRDKEAHETIISLALMSMTAAALADQRELRDEHHELPPAKPAPRRPRRRRAGAGANRRVRGASKQTSGSATVVQHGTATIGASVDASRWTGYGKGEAVFRC
jgi:hypothetical protein